MVDSPDALNDLLERERMIVRIARLEAALREALDGWKEWRDEGHALPSQRITELRAQFLDDK